VKLRKLLLADAHSHSSEASTSVSSDLGPTQSPKPSDRKLTKEELGGLSPGDRRVYLIMYVTTKDLVYIFSLKLRINRKYPQQYMYFVGVTKLQKEWTANQHRFAVH
jgi:hypothetical protein